MAARDERRSFWTWGYVSDEPGDQARAEAAGKLASRLGAHVTPPPIPAIEHIALSRPRIDIPSNLQAWIKNDHVDRVTHTYGGHPLELLAAMRGEFVNPPDAIAHPHNEDELEATLAWPSERPSTTMRPGAAASRSALFGKRFSGQWVSIQPRP